MGLHCERKQLKNNYCKQKVIVVRQDFLKIKLVYEINVKTWDKNCF